MIISAQWTGTNQRRSWGRWRAEDATRCFNFMIYEWLPLYNTKPRDSCRWNEKIRNMNIEMGNIFSKNQKCNMITKFRSYHTALQILGGFIFVQVCWFFFFFLSWRVKEFIPKKRLGRSSSLARFCFTNSQWVCAVSDRLNVGPGWASSVFWHAICSVLVLLH